jgi:2-keto-3-deoxy-L-rhamnonate aldolase RhmA
MVETETAVKNIEAICAVPGLAGVYVGPVDLGISLGISPTSAADSSIVADKVTTVVNACRSAGIVAGINAMTGAEAADFAARGFRFITVSRDLSMLALGASAELEAARGAAPPEG